MLVADLLGDVRASDFVANSGTSAGNNIITGSRNFPEIEFGANVSTSEEEEQETPAEETKKRKRKRECVPILSNHTLKLKGILLNY